MPRKIKLLSVIFYALVFILLIGFFVYDHAYYSYRQSTREFEVNKYLESPEIYGNHQAERMAKIVSISQGHFYIRSGNVELKVMGSGIKKPVLGESVFFLDFRKDGVIGLIDYHNYNFNYFLYGVSAIAIIVFVIIFFKEWKLTKRGFEDA